MSQKKILLMVCFGGLILLFLSFFLPYYEIVITDVYYPDYSDIPPDRFTGFSYIFNNTAMSILLLIVSILTLNFQMAFFVIITIPIPVSLVLFIISLIKFLITLNRLQDNDFQRIFKLLLGGAVLYLISMLEVIFLPLSQSFLGGEPQLYNPMEGAFLAAIASSIIIICSIWGLIVKESPNEAGDILDAKNKW